MVGFTYPLDNRRPRALVAQGERLPAPDWDTLQRMGGRLVMRNVRVFRFHHAWDGFYAIWVTLIPLNKSILR